MHDLVMLIHKNHTVYFPTPLQEENVEMDGKRINLEFALSAVGSGEDVHVQNLCTIAGSELDIFYQM